MASNLRAMASNLLISNGFCLHEGAPPGTGGGEGAECRGLKVNQLNKKEDQGEEVPEVVPAAIKAQPVTHV